MGFAGFPMAAVDFYVDLEVDNSKAFWTANKARYEEVVRAPFEALAAAVEGEFGTAKLFRPYRDLRFSKDPRPYKTHQGMYFPDTHRYVQISAEGILVAGGYWHLESDQVRRLRAAIADDSSGAALAKVVAGLPVDGERLTRVPAGFAKDHPRADLLRYKSLTAHEDLDPPSSQQQIVAAWRRFGPLVDWLDTHVG